MRGARTILRRALKDGFNLSTLPNYSPERFSAGLYDHLVSKHYVVSQEEDAIYVGYDIIVDVAEIIVKDDTMTIKPLSEDGFFDILIELFKYIGIAASEKHLSKKPEDVSTEDYSEESSEEWWL